MRHLELQVVLMLFAAAACAPQDGKAGAQGAPGVPCEGCVDGATIAPGAVSDAHLSSAGITTRTKLPAPLCYEDEPNTFTQDQTVSANLAVSGSVIVGATGAAAAALDVHGEVLSEGLLQTGMGVPVPYAVSTRRYVVEVNPELAGTVVPLDQALVERLCKDVDGCEITLAMVNWDGLGAVASRRSRLFLSQTHDIWRLDNDVTGLDGANVSDWSAFDCVFTDAETSLDAANGREDARVGFGLLNVLGGGYGDLGTRCRLIIAD